MVVVEALFIHLIVPAAGIIWFLRLRDDMPSNRLKARPCSRFLSFLRPMAAAAGYPYNVLLVLVGYGVARSGISILPRADSHACHRVAALSATQFVSFSQVAFVGSICYVGVIACLIVGGIAWKVLFKQWT